MRYGFLLIIIIGMVILSCGCVTNDIVSPRVVPSSLPPSHIMLYQNGSLIAGGDDHITIDAKVTDSLDRPVTDGINISFTVNEAPWVPEKNGSISENDSDQSLQSVTVKTKGGWANISYGWINRSYAENNSTITVIYTNDPIINNSTVVHCYQGSIFNAYVVDSFGIGYGGATVTLHVVGKDGVHDVYNMTNTTIDLEPYLGLFTVKFVLYPNSSYAYISAVAPYQKGVAATGRTNNYTVNYGHGVWLGSIVLRIPPPNAIKVTADPAIIVAGGHNSTITARLMLNGSPYLRSGYKISFSSDNDSIGYLPPEKNYTTDINGIAHITLTSNTSIGEVNVTACNPDYSFGYGNLTDTCIIKVVP